MGVITVESSTRSRTCLPVTLTWTGGSKKTSALIDSGMEKSFLDAGAAARWGVPLVEVSHPLVANSLNGQRIGRITKATVPIRLQISSNHQETISLLIIDNPALTDHSGPSVDVHPKHRSRLEETQDPGLEPRLLDEVSAQGAVPDFCSLVRGESEPG